MSGFLEAFSWLYPCSVCATDLRQEMKNSPPELGSREELAMWLCEQHNKVNVKLGKPVFKCSMRRLTMLYTSKAQGGFINEDSVK